MRALRMHFNVVIIAALILFPISLLTYDCAKTPATSWHFPESRYEPIPAGP